MNFKEMCIAVSTEKKKRCTTWGLWVELFIWGQMRTAAGEVAFQIALRDCSKVAMGESQYIRFWWRGSSVPWSTHFTKGFCYSWGSDVTMKGFSASLDMKRYKDWDHCMISHVQSQRNPNRMVGTGVAVRRFHKYKGEGEAPARW